MHPLGAIDKSAHVERGLLADVLTTVGPSATLVWERRGRHFEDRCGARETGRKASFAVDAEGSRVAGGLESSGRDDLL